MNFINKKNLANICGMLVWFHNKTELFQHLSTTTFNGEQAKYAKTGFRCCLLSLCHSLLFFRNYWYVVWAHYTFLFFFNLTNLFFSTLPTLPLLEFWKFLLLTYLQTLYIPLTQGDTKFSRLVVIIQYLQEPMVETNCSLDPVL